MWPSEWTADPTFQLAAVPAAHAGATPPFTMAFQPIVDVAVRAVFAQEALVRSATGGTAEEVFARVHPGNRDAFDLACRRRAIEFAADLRFRSRLSINLLPNAASQPSLGIEATLAAADAAGFPVDRIVFEFTEGEHVHDRRQLRDTVRAFQSRGFQTAIDDFGAGHSGLNLLADILPDLIKLDLALVRDVHRDRGRRAIIRGVQAFCRDLGIVVIAEGIEDVDEFRALQDLGIDLFQGYLFGPPALESFTVPHIPLP
jgi:EAL domain-containing protein (putative c-di-GMP-specific phosphodiesterase class I)